jgi:hypothetical protein
MISSGNKELDGFIAKYTPEIAALTHALFAKMRARLPGATIPVYDNYNALAIGFWGNAKMASAIFSLAAYPRWVTLFFFRGVGLDDPDGLLEGKGTVVRSIPKITPERLDDPRIEALIAQSLARCHPLYDPSANSEIIIKSISAKQRPRRPVK